MNDIVLVATIVVFFLAAALLVRACGHITDGAQPDEDVESDPHPRQPA